MNEFDFGDAFGPMDGTGLTGDAFGSGCGGVGGSGFDAFGGYENDFCGGYDAFGAQDAYSQNAFQGMQAFQGLGCGLVNESVRQQLITLGFTAEEVNAFEIVQADWGNVTQQRILQYGIPYIEAQKIKYLADIVYGKVTVDSEDELIKHLKKMKLSNKKVGIWDLEATTINKMPRKCLIKGLPAGTPFVLYNSGKNRRTFDVVDNIGSSAIIRCELIPKLPYGDSKKLVRLRDVRANRFRYYRSTDEIPKEYKEDNLRYKVQTVAELLETNGKQILVKIHHDYYRMCGRFIIVGSLKYPDKHLGLVKLITLDGTRVYVYVKQADYGEKVKYSGGSERIYDYGFDYSKAYDKLVACATNVANKVGSVYANYEPAVVDFEVIEKYVPREVGDSDGDEEAPYELGEDSRLGSTRSTKETEAGDGW